MATKLLKTPKPQTQAQSKQPCSFAGGSRPMHVTLVTVSSYHYERVVLDSSREGNSARQCPSSCKRES